MQMSWRSAFAVDGVAAALVVGGVLAALLLVNLVSHSTKKKRKKAEASFRLNVEELVAQQDGSNGSSMDSLLTSMSVSEVGLGEAEDLDGALISPDKSLWTAHSAFESDTDECSETEMRERQARLQETMRERVVRDDWFVYGREWVRFGKKFAEGGQAEIYAATTRVPYFRNGALTEVAVKKFKSFKGISQGHNPPGLHSFKCMHVCLPTGVFFDDGQLCLVMPRLQGDLRAVIDREMELHPAPPFPEPVALHIIMQLAIGLKGLHEAGIYHRDLKAGNVLQVEEMKEKGWDAYKTYKVYISDFESSEDVIGTGFYRAPEVLRRVQARLEGRAGGRARLLEHEWAAADVYSFGMICYEILTGELPKIGDKWSDFSMALSGHRPELPPSVVPEGLRVIIEGCWDDDPQSRPSATEIVECVRTIDNYGLARDCLTEVEMLATAEVTTGNLEDDVQEFDRLLMRQILADGNPTLIHVGKEFLVYVQEYIPKFHALAHLPQQSFPLQKYMELWKLLHLIEWTKIKFAKTQREAGESGDDSVYEHESMRMCSLVRAIQAATRKTNLRRSRLAHTDGLHMHEKMALLRDFVEPQLAAGVWMEHMCIRSEVIIRQISHRTHRWALRCHLFVLCVIHPLRTELHYFVPYVVKFLVKSKVLGWILVRVLGRDYSLFWCLDLSPAIGYRSLLMRYICHRKASRLQWYWRLLYVYIVGNGKVFDYLFLFYLAYIVYTIVALVRTTYYVAKLIQGSLGFPTHKVAFSIKAQYRKGSLG